jgi:hypothetical protein
MIYLIQPYTDPDPAMMNWRAHEGALAANWLLASGNLVYSPVAHGHAIQAAQPNIPISYAIWIAHGLTMLKLCDKAMFLRLPGWSKSQGVTLELVKCKELGLEILEYSGPGYPNGGSPK